MKYTTVKISEIAKHPTMRMDAKYWIKKKSKKEKSCKPQAPSCKLDNGPGTMQDEFKYDNFDRQNFSITVVGPDDKLQKGPHETMKGQL